MNELRTKQLAQWTIADLEQVVSEEWEESIEFEIKQDLQIPDGAKGWREKQQLHKSEKSDLAKEVVALANARGGIIIIGIVESQESPKRAAALATPLPKVSDLADRLSQALHSMIDPQILGLEIQAVSDGDKDGGYIAIGVPASPTPPHGFGTPALAYRRVDDRSEPMMMRDLQNSFWDGRMRRERVSELRAEKRTNFENLGVPGEYIGYRLSLITTQNMLIDDIEGRIKSREIKLNSLRQNSSLTLGERDIRNQYNWKTDVHGVSREFIKANDHINCTEYWEIDETGAISVQGNHSGLRNDSGNPYLRWDWILGSVANLILIARSLEDAPRVGRQNWEFDAEFLVESKNFFVSTGSKYYETTHPIPPGIRLTRPIPIKTLQSDASLRLIQQKIAGCFRIDGVPTSGLTEIVGSVSSP